MTTDRRADDDRREDARLLNLQQAIETAGVSRRTIFNWAARGEIESIGRYTQRRYTASSVKARAAVKAELDAWYRRRRRRSRQDGERA